MGLRASVVIAVCRLGPRDHRWFFPRGSAQRCHPGTFQLTRTRSSSARLELSLEFCGELGFSTNADEAVVFMGSRDAVAVCDLFFERERVEYWLAAQAERQYVGPHGMAPLPFVSFVDQALGAARAYSHRSRPGQLVSPGARYVVRLLLCGWAGIAPKTLASDRGAERTTKTMDGQLRSMPPDRAEINDYLNAGDRADRHGSS